MNKNVLIVDILYFANITYYKKIVNSSHIFFDQCDYHKKSSFSNRSVISGANGLITLSVPLEKGRSQKTQFKDVRIANAEKWQQRHWRGIISSYNNSPWFKYYSDDLAVIFSTHFDFLRDWNLACLNWTFKILKLNIEVELTNEWNEHTPALEDFRNKVFPGSGETDGIFRYAQVFEDRLGFIPNLSILDLIFCEGPKNAVSLLKG